VRREGPSASSDAAFASQRTVRAYHRNQGRQQIERVKAWTHRCRTRRRGVLSAAEAGTVGKWMAFQNLLFDRSRLNGG
jgi:hypothetical protein